MIRNIYNGDRYTDVMSPILLLFLATPHELLTIIAKYSNPASQ